MTTVACDLIIIATGSQQRNQPDIPFDHKVIVDSTSIFGITEIPQSLIILGVRILGGGATEVIHTAQMSIFHNAKTHIFIDNIFNYPTYSEALEISALGAANLIQNQRG